MAHCKNGRKSVPVNKRLYNTLKRKIKARSKVWPSAYASGQLVRAYESEGGKYRCSFGSLDRWFKEKWVNVCQPLGNGKYKSCGRKKSSWRNYPYCRPLRRVNKNTPVTVREMGKNKIKKMCNRKRKNPRKKVFQRNKNNFGEYNMNKPEQQTCGYGNRRRPRFGIHREHPDIPLENRDYLRGKFQEADTAKIMYYENIYMNQPIHIKGTPESKRYTVLDFRMYTPVGDSLFSYYDDDGEFRMVKASQVTGFDTLPPPPEVDIFGFGNRRRPRFGNNLGPTNSNLDTFYRNGTANSINPETVCLAGYYGKYVSRFGRKRKNTFESDIIYLKSL
jgi:hypothetical protein